MIWSPFIFKAIKLVVLGGLAFVLQGYGHERLALGVLLLWIAFPDPDFTGRARGDWTEMSNREALMSLYLNQRQRDWIAGLAGIKLADAVVRIRALRGFGDDPVQMIIKLSIKPVGEQDFYDVTGEAPIAVLPHTVTDEEPE